MTTTSSAAPVQKAPGVVTLVAILALLVGIFSVLGGVLLIATGIGNPSALDQSTGVLLTLGVLYLLLGFAALAVFKALRQGKAWARMLFTVVLVVGVIVHIVNIFAGNGLGGSIWGLIVDIAALVALWGVQASRDFFDANA